MSAQQKVVLDDGKGSRCTLTERLVPEELLEPIVRHLDADRGCNEIMQRREVQMFGKTFRTPRKEWHVGDEGVVYRYSRGALMRCTGDWGPVRALREFVEEQTGETYNFCLLNWYGDGSDKVGWHADDEPTVVPDSTIACVSVGTTRKFVLRANADRKNKTSVQLTHRSLFTMEGETQRHYQHTLPPSKRVSGWRLSLTFRKNTEKKINK